MPHLQFSIQLVYRAIVTLARFEPKKYTTVKQKFEIYLIFMFINFLTLQNTETLILDLFWTYAHIKKPDF